MSVYIVSIHHIRALVNAGLNLRDGPLRWERSVPTAEQRERAYQRGMPWGSEALEVVKEITAVLTRETAERVGAMLVAQNRYSADFRYDESEIEELYTHGPSSRRTVIELLGAINCYEYQACETPDWEQSEAYRFCDALRRALIRELPGWNNVPWGIDNP